MNIFEDLIDELKDENLLEATVIETAKAESDAKTERDAKRIESENSVKESVNENFENQEVLDFQEILASPPAPQPYAAQTDNAEVFHTQTAENLTENIEVNENVSQNQPPETAEPVDQVEFFRKRATDEVLCLQMVEHVFAGVARQQEKTVPKAYDDLKVKKDLHNFLQVSADPQSPEHAEADFLLRQETENWYAALSHNDRQISVSHLRHYCETAKPILSSQALISLARFYRNSPYSEAVRAKFDLVVTRLFSRELYNRKRELISEKDTLVKHLSRLYAEWESVSLYTSEEDESEVMLTALNFEKFIDEAESAESFDELIRNDFFNRLRSFKQSTNEQFFTPLVTATAVEGNAKIGNKYIDLLEREKENGSIEKLENTYGFLHDQVISDAVSKSLELVDILKTKFVMPEPVAKPEETVREQVVKNKETPKRINEVPKKEKQKLSSQKAVKKGVNKWLVAAVIATLLISGMLFLWSGSTSEEDVKSSQDVKKLTFDNSALNEYIRDARIGNNTFFGIVLPNWENLSQDEKTEVLKKILSISQEKGFKDVRLINTEGKTVASVAGGVIDIRK
ncbi:MAG: hypothetical protein M3033_15885 [Acidobacteriota bacterium]|nr:hypothetical protein [Acidobacteriota bacterium]